MNSISLRSTSGLARLEWNDRGTWRDVRTGLRKRNLQVITAPGLARCPKQATLLIFVPTPTRPARLDIRLTECNGDEEEFELELGVEWRVFMERFRTLKVGERACTPFTVSSGGPGYVILEKVSSPSPLFTISYTGIRPPVRIRGGSEYQYDVCFTAPGPGVYKMPILTYIRREQPNGGYNNFIVADTAIVRVEAPLAVRRPKPPPVVRPRPVPPRPKPPVAARPKPVVPRPVRPRPVPVIPAPEPQRIADVTTIVLQPHWERGIQPAPPAVGREVTFEPVESTAVLVDPTTFRNIAMPTARPIDGGTGFVASYDIAAIVAGYGVTDRLSLIGGMLYLPRFIGPAFDATIGARYEVVQAGSLRVAGGVQLNYSSTDSSSIALAAPYAVTSVGDDDARLNVALGYSVRRHSPVGIEPFTREGLFVGIGGDYRIGFHWKLAAEAFLLQRSDVQPVAATVRYFTERYAIDAGLVADLGADANAKFRIGPVVSLVWVW